MSMSPLRQRMFNKLQHLWRRARAPLWKRRHVGKGSLVERSVHVLGWRSVRIGRNTVIGGGSVLNVNNGRGKVRIRIDDFVYVGRFGFFNNGALIHLKDYAMIGPNCHFIGANHVFSDPFQPYIATGTTEDFEIVIGVNCWLGANVTVLGDVAIGHGSVVGARALVTRHIPPFSLAVGTPARVTKRFDMASRTWVAAADFTPAMETLLPDEDSYRATLRAGFPSINMPYAAAGPSRGDLA